MSPCLCEEGVCLVQAKFARVCLCWQCLWELVTAMPGCMSLELIARGCLAGFQVAMREDAMREDGKAAAATVEGVAVPDHRCGRAVSGP